MLPDRKDSVLRGIRERSQQNGVDRAEDRCIRADPESERQHRDPGEAGGSPELAKGVQEILYHGAEHVVAPGVGGDLGPFRDHTPPSSDARPAGIWPISPWIHPAPPTIIQTRFRTGVPDTRPPEGRRCPQPRPPEASPSTSVTGWSRWASWSPASAWSSSTGRSYRWRPSEAGRRRA